MNSTSPSRDVGRFRKLRIAWSVVCGIVCVLLIALWMRSYRWRDGIGGRVLGRYADIVTGFGEFRVLLLEPLPGTTGIRLYSRENTGSTPNAHWGKVDQGGLGYRWRIYSNGVHIQASFWWPVVFATVSSVLPWIRWRFSLRTLLIATTLVSVGLGLVVYAARK